MAICEKCIKKSVCKLCDGSAIMGCIEFVSKGKCVRASKGQELNCSEIPAGSIDYISKQEVVGLMMHIWGKNFSGDDAMQERIDAIRVMPPVKLQLSSGTRKNSKKLEKDFGELDCISRKAVLNKILKFSVTEGRSVSVKNLRTEINELPPITLQEPKTGHWYRQTNDYVDYYECSECGMAMGLYDVKNYCPNCGSRNEVEE